MPDYSTPGVYIAENLTAPPPIEATSTTIAGFVGVAETSYRLNQPTKIHSWAEYTRHFGRYSQTAPYLAPAVCSFFKNGGQACYIVNVADQSDSSLIGFDSTDGSASGLQSLKAVDEISTLCIPGATSLNVQLAMITHCESQDDRFCILDSQEAAILNDIQQQRTLLHSDRGFAGLYYPWIEVAVEKQSATGELQLENRFIPPSGAIAGIYALNDLQRGVHKAPANMAIRDAIGLERNISQSEQSLLNPQGINCIRLIDSQGIRVWGARTLADTSDELKYVPVRRLLLFLQESIQKSIQWSVFEPNDEPLWANIRLSVENFLLQNWRDGAFQGSRPDEAFFVRCDRSGMTPEQIRAGIMIVTIGIAAIKPAEFIVFRIAQKTGDADIT
ncbi:phage tail sheath subtilisin-like domain-containing protein [Thiomicrorhabdus sp. 6S3-12]|uniref:phage tail sheath family protein n=1 Tax=Thiomicrorhabdus sp. 6S3-12 TaxID=2819681 RepID=UPI001AAC8016|nr:phage tail sheath subtilisin-like domain-containing protein [Thiomicrorhabdus sp. 6S3-12]MBO1923371.1 phage tail sheath family protein [Thiomicrorhabdus sp. 6S3-12]